MELYDNMCLNLEQHITGMCFDIIYSQFFQLWGNKWLPCVRIELTTSDYETDALTEQGNDWQIYVVALRSIWLQINEQWQFPLQLNYLASWGLYLRYTERYVNKRTNVQFTSISLPFSKTSLFVFLVLKYSALHLKSGSTYHYVWVSNT